MRLRTYLYCRECGDETVHEWVEIWKGLWIFKCLRCGNEQYRDPDILKIEWISEQEDSEG